VIVGEEEIEKALRFSKTIKMQGQEIYKYNWWNMERKVL